MNKLDPTPADHRSRENPFLEARAQLSLSQKELAEKLNTSYYALVRWERGDQEPTQDILARLDGLRHGKAPEGSRSQVDKREVVFESNGARANIRPLPLFSVDEVPMLKAPRETILEDLRDGELWGDSEIALADVLSRNSTPAQTTDTPFDEEVSAGKNTYTYDAHTYHTKVPPQGIANVIREYLPDGGLVLDPFGGSGMTGVAARYLGYDVILNELSPAAGFIAHNFLQTVDVDEFNQCVSQIMDSLSELRGQLYNTECRECGSTVEQQFAVWSYQLECNHCEEKFVLWDHCRKYGRTVREHKLLRKFPCPHCGEEVNKSYLKRFEPVPVFLGYKCCSKKIVEHPLLKTDLEKTAVCEDILLKYRDDIPNQPLPDGVNLSQPKRHGLDAVEKFYTKRNLIACAAIWREIRKIEDPNLAAAVGFVFTSLYQRVTRLSEYRFWGGSGNTANFNVPQIFNETNVFVTFERKAKSIADHFVTTAKNYGGRALVRTGSATDMGFLPDDSIDFIFTDPPFGANINYSEMNILWETWLGAFTDATDEAIMNRSQGKGVEDYQALMQRSLEEANRVLRPNHWMVLVFMNSSEKVWTALQNAIVDAGFVIEKVNIFDKQHGTFKQFVSENTAGADLMIHCRKHSGDEAKKVPEERPTLEVFDFLESQKDSIPVLPFLHVKRDAEVDYRTLYSRYIAEAMNGAGYVVGFSDFRGKAAEFFEGEK
ncbi:DNA methyltransferase [Ponticoccus alexandrii]|uniref:site-specific DNA-methyltransferase (adenine-specific) n=1 Tax=Ponticoccus alexandrii TaxID=1943633 RepID=A0ABX7FD27_9RHOB|nr:DNA methyltransferase [Ponticoccus alexandrii]QRF67272.1 helix-turn-helix domain-containing protein [Ponticoccus alexandrii]